MNLALDEEQQQVAEAIERFLAQELPIASVRELNRNRAGRALDDGTWKRCAELGWLGLAIPEEHGGAGLGAAEELLLFQRLGRGVAPGPFRSTVIAAHAAVAAGARELARELVSGNWRVGLRVGDLGVDAHRGDLVLELAGDRVTLFEVAQASADVGIDPTSRASEIELGPEILHLDSEAIVTRARILVAAEALGVSEATRDMSAAYARTREQFGRPIGAFQAVKHRCADMAVGAYAADALVRFAATYLDAGSPDAAFQAAAAHLVAIETARRNIVDNIQNHGAIAFTLEHDAHLYARRAFLLERALGPLRLSMLRVLQPERHEYR